MKRSQIIALGAATLACAVAPAAALAAGPTTVSVRIEGKSRTLLRAAAVRTRTGSITKGGTPAGKCPATTAAGALDAATRGRWGGNYGSYGLSVTSILGESHSFTSPYYWSIFVDGRYATAGVCGLNLHRGEQLLFAAVSVKGNPYPLVISAPRRAVRGRAFRVRVSYDRNGAIRPLAGAAVTGARATNAAGVTTVTPARSGSLTLTASRTGYVRTEATVSVSS